MTRVYYQAGRLRLRVLLFAALVCALFGVLNLAAYSAFFDMSPAQLWQQVAVLSVAVGVVYAILAIYTWFALRPVARLLLALREHGIGGQHEDEARKAALRFPLAFATLALGAGGIAVLCGMVADVLVTGMGLAFAVGLAFATTTELMVTCAFVYLVLRAIMRPIIAHFRHEEVPSGIRITVASKVTFAIVSLCLAVSIPTALIGSKRLQVIQRSDHEQSRTYLARALAHGAKFLPPGALDHSIAAVHLSRGGRIRLVGQPTDGSAALPAPHGPSGARHVEVMTPPSDSQPHAQLVVLAVLLLGLATFVGRRLGTNVAQDVELVSGRIRQLAEHLPLTEQGQLKPLIADLPQFSDLRQLADALNDLLARIVEISVTHFLAIEKTLEADRVKTQFLANFSHDLRSPLNSVLGFSQLLLREPEDGLNARQKRDLELILRCGNQLLLMINQVLDSAKIDAGRMTAHREDSLPAELLSKAIKETQRRGVPDGIQVETELQAGMQAVLVDPQRLVQAMAYIIQFCIDSMEHGRIVAQLSLRSSSTASGEKRQHLIFRVATTSGGLPERELQGLFHGFRRRPGRRGLGLELPLSRSLVELQDGALQVTSSGGMGTTFTADIPLLQPKVLARLRPPKGSPAGRAGKGKAEKK